MKEHELIWEGNVTQWPGVLCGFGFQVGNDVDTEGALVWRWALPQYNDHLDLPLSAGMYGQMLLT